MIWSVMRATNWPVDYWEEMGNCHLCAGKEINGNDMKWRETHWVWGKVWGKSYPLFPMSSNSAVRHFRTKKTPIFTDTPARFRPWRQAWRCSPGIVGFQVGSREFVAATFQQSHATALHAKRWRWTSNWGKGGRTNMASNHKLINREALQVFGPNACRISYHASMPKPTVSKVKV